MKKEIKVTNRIYTSPDDSVSRDGVHWSPARPQLYFTNIFERVWHWLGHHWSYGQPYCIVCGLAEKIVKQPEVYMTFNRIKKRLDIK